MYKLDFPTPEEAQARNAAITLNRGYDGVNTVYCLDVIDSSIIIKEGDFQGITFAEIQSLTTYEEK